MALMHKETFEILNWSEINSMVDVSIYCEIDDMIVNTISILNKKGYKTFNCCSGHNVFILSSTYIDFDKNTIPKQFPNGFFLEDEAYYKEHYPKAKRNKDRLCIRKKYKGGYVGEGKMLEIINTMFELREWAEGLPHI